MMLHELERIEQVALWMGEKGVARRARRAIEEWLKLEADRAERSRKIRERERRG